ncbi:MAG: transposase, partial [Clostridium sp.]|nr:transposase [Clostridium sp.]MCM1444763.1 hypothetical protein [Candidatus Amulumruptor caecigallinarius]
EEKEQEKIMNTRLLYAEEQGMKNGMEKGIAKNKIEIAKNMLKEGSTIDFIAKVTDLSINDIKELM